MREVGFFFCLYLLCGSVYQVNPGLAWTLAGISLALLALRLVSLVIQNLIIPAFHITGGIFYDLAEAMSSLYQMTLGPVLRFTFPLMRSGLGFARSTLAKEPKGRAGSQAHTEEDDIPPGSQETREERFHRRQEQRQRTRRAEPREQPHSCYSILGISPDADYEAGKRAYRELSLKYHPDRVQHLGEEFQLLAGQRFKAIGSAWQEFKLLKAPERQSED